MLKSILRNVSNLYYRQKTRYNFHVIIVNDGSTDRSRDILKRYENHIRITIIDQKNKGLSGARNTGLKYAEGMYVCFVDSDDRLPLDSIESLMNTAMEGDYDLVFGGYVRLDNNKWTQRMFPKPGVLFGMPWGKVYKAGVWDKIQFPENYWFEDTITEFIIKGKVASIASVQKIVYEWRINRKSITFSSVGNPKVLDSVYVTLRLFEDRKQLGLPMDKLFYSSLLLQFKINARRIYSLGNDQINYANFIVSKTLFEKYYDKKYDTTMLCREIATSLVTNNYKRFILASILL